MIVMKNGYFEQYFKDFICIWPDDTPQRYIFCISTLAIRNEVI